MIAILPDMEKYPSPVSKRVIVPKNIGTQKCFHPHLHCLFFTRHAHLRSILCAPLVIV